MYCNKENQDLSGTKQKVRLLFGNLYPAYASYKAVRTKNVKEYVKWMMYWIVFALFTCCETFTDVFFSFWFPFYYEIKIVLVIWLLSPATKGSSFLYRKFVHPMLTKREPEIDEYISRAKEQSYHTVLHLGTRGMSYATNVIMQTAIKGGGGIVNHLRRSYSLCDLTSDNSDLLSDLNRSSKQMTQSEDDADAPRDLPQQRMTRSSRKAAGGSHMDLYFPEVDVNIRNHPNREPSVPLNQIRSTDDISSGYSSADPVYIAEGAGEGLQRTSSVGGARARTRGTVGRAPSTRKGLTTEDSDLLEEELDLELTEWDEGDPTTASRRHHIPSFPGYYPIQAPFSSQPVYFTGPNQLPVSSLPFNDSRALVNQLVFKAFQETQPYNVYEYFNRRLEPFDSRIEGSGPTRTVLDLQNSEILSKGSECVEDDRNVLEKQDVELKSSVKELEKITKEEITEKEEKEKDVPAQTVSSQISVAIEKSIQDSQISEIENKADSSFVPEIESVEFVDADDSTPAMSSPSGIPLNCDSAAVNSTSGISLNTPESVTSQSSTFEDVKLESKHYGKGRYNKRKHAPPPPSSLAKKLEDEDDFQDAESDVEDTAVKPDIISQLDKIPESCKKDESVEIVHEAAEKVEKSPSNERKLKRKPSGSKLTKLFNFWHKDSSPYDETKTSSENVATGNQHEDNKTTVLGDPPEEVYFIPLTDEDPKESDEYKESGIKNAEEKDERVDEEGRVRIREMSQSPTAKRRHL